MKREYITGNFYEDLKKTIALIDDNNVKLSAKEELIEDFCSVYVYFDSNKLYNYLFEGKKLNAN